LPSGLSPSCPRPNRAARRFCSRCWDRRSMQPNDPLRANLVERVADWQWCSLWRHCHGDAAIHHCRVAVDRSAQRTAKRSSLEATLSTRAASQGIGPVITQNTTSSPFSRAESRLPEMAEPSSHKGDPQSPFTIFGDYQPSSQY
jgi:hypothetical protein